jgi:hypothetical protein
MAVATVAQLSSSQVGGPRVDQLFFPLSGILRRATPEK